MPNSLILLSQGAVLGFTAGIAPGPLTILVITQTLRYGFIEGLKIAIAPLFTDLPIILLCYFILAHVNHFSGILALISFAGACFLVRMGRDMWRATPAETESEQIAPRSYVQGIVTNLLNPHPYVFWLTVGTPIAMSSTAGVGAGFGFFASSMLISMIAAKLILASIARTYSNVLKGKGYITFLKVSAVCLFGFAISFIHSGLTSVGWHI